jgi:peptidoglycan/xylan/chitin deacetylase (PgdA/CDA1 family)
MERDFVGYADTPPRVPWPGGAHLAVQVSVSYEEGAEYSLLDGPRRETMGEVPSAVAPELRDLFNESFFEYGSRVGVWRILDTLERYDVPASWWVCARALERNPRVAQALVDSGHEICGHGYGWEDFSASSRDEELDNIRRTVASIERITGQRPLGWFTRYACSPNTRELLAEEGGFVYDSLGLNDDLPYYVTVRERPWLVVPYTFEVNDTRFWRGGLVSVGDFTEYMTSAFDCLYAESRRVPRMMSVGLHCRIAGSPARSRSLIDFLEYARKFSGVWFARRIDIARWWLEHQPPSQRERA